MNVRLAKDAIRLRVSKEEFSQLQTGGVVQVSTPLSGQAVLSFVVMQNPNRCALAELELEFSSMCLTVRVSEAGMQSVVARENARQGIQSTVSLGAERSVRCSLQIDVRSGSTRASA